MTDNVTRLYPDHDEDGDGISESTELVEWEPAPVPVVRQSSISLAAARILPAKAERADWLDQCRGALEYRGKAVLFHGVRLPLYGGRYSTFAGRGLGRVTVRLWHWTHDTEGLQIRVRAATDPTLDAAAAQRAHAAAHDARVVRIRWRRIFVGALSLFLLLVARWGIHAHPWWSVLAGGGIAVVLGMVGSQRGEVIQHLEDPTPQVISIDAVVRAFFKAKIAKDLDEPARVIGVPHKDGPGTVIRCEVPDGTTFDDVLKSRDRLASALHCPKQCLELDDLPDEAEALLELFIADQPPSKVPPPTWPLLMVDRWDLFQPLPVGVTPKGKPVCLSLMWVHTLIGAAPRRGKTTLLRMIALATLLDPRAKLAIVDFGGGLDYRAFEPHCLKFIHGPEVEQIQEFYDFLGWLDSEYRRRQAALSRMPVSKCPEARLTPALAELPEFAPINVVVDEFQIATLARKVGDIAKMGEEVILRWAELKKVCPKVGITFFDATQAADDSVPTELRNVSLQRVALSMASFQGSMAILGNTAQKLGYDASTLGGLPGLAYSWGTDSGVTDGYRGKVRFANVTPADAAALLERITRIRGPQVTIHAEAHDLDEEDQAEPEAPAIIRAALRHWPRPEMNCHQDVLAQLMNMDQADLGQSMRQAGIPAEPVKMRRPGEDRTSGKRGYHLVDLEAVTR